MSMNHCASADRESVTVTKQCTRKGSEEDCKLANTDVSHAGCQTFTKSASQMFYEEGNMYSMFV